MSRSSCSTTPRCSARSTSSRSSTWVANGPSRKPLPGVTALPMRISRRRQRPERPAQPAHQRRGEPADRVGVLAADGARTDPDDDEADHRHRARRDERGEPAGRPDGGDGDQRDQGGRGELADQPQQQQQVGVAGRVGRDRPAARGRRAPLPGQLGGAGRRHRESAASDIANNPASTTSPAAARISGVSRWLSLVGRLRQPSSSLACSANISALLVRLRVVVAEQVQNTVHGQQVQLVGVACPAVRPASPPPRGTARRRRAASARRRRSRSGRGRCVPSSIGKASTSVGPSPPIQRWFSSAMYATSTSRTDSSASGLTPISSRA